MKQRSRISQVLFILVLCMMILYVGSRLTKGFAEEANGRLNSLFIKRSEQMYLTGFSFFSDGETGTPIEWIAQCACYMLPLGSYVEETAFSDMEVEDRETYEWILEMQANDENEVDEKGNLINAEKAGVDKEKASAEKTQGVDVSLEKLHDFDYLVSHFYTVDSSTSVSAEDLNAEALLQKDLKIDQSVDGPKILIYHTHSQEDFQDSKKGDESTTIMGMGAYLAELLNERYDIETMHHRGIYDLIDGEMDRSKAYQLAEKQVSKILEENPGIEIVIDLHRDGVGKDTRLVTEIDGKPTAQIMFFNGMSRTKANGDIAYLYNPYIQDNLAFSLQMQITAAKLYPGFTRHIYLKSYRYNMHLKPKTLLIEAGAQTNTVEEMRNAMAALANVLNECVNAK